MIKIKDSDNKPIAKSLYFFIFAGLIYLSITNVNFIFGKAASFILLFSPLVVGMLFALILLRPMDFICNLLLKIKRKSKSKHKPSDRALEIISLVLTLIMAIVILFFIGNIVVPQIITSFKNIIVSIKTYIPKLVKLASDKGYSTAQLESIISNIDFEKILSAIEQNATKLFDTAIGAVSGIATLTINLISSFIFSIYILANKKTIKRQSKKVLIAYFSPQNAKKLYSIARLTVSTFTSFFSGQCLEAIILGTIFFVSMTVFGFPYATVVSVIISITAFIPYVGTFIGCAIGVLLILMQDPMQSLLFVVMFIVIQQIENNLIYPHVVGNSVNLPSIWTFIAVIVGGALFGVGGMMFFIPITAIAYSLIRADVNDRIDKKYEADSDMLTKVFDGNVKTDVSVTGQKKESSDEVSVIK